MEWNDWVGFTGVSILLVAFFLNITNNITKEGTLYLTLNFIGAGIACFASVLINYVPFIILEGCWTLVSLYGLIKNFKR